MLMKNNFDWNCRVDPSATKLVLVHKRKQIFRMTNGDKDGDKK